MVPGSVLCHSVNISEPLNIPGLQQFLGVRRSQGNSQSHWRSLHSGASCSPLSFAHPLGWRFPSIMGLLPLLGALPYQYEHIKWGPLVINVVDM